MITKGKPVVINRPVQKLYPLEVKAQTLKPSLDEEQEVNKSGGKVNKMEVVVDVRGTPHRAAAMDAGWKCRLMLDSDNL